MTVDVETAASLGLAWPTTGTPAVAKPRQGGRHRWDKGGPVIDGRKQITTPVDADYNPLHPADRTALAPHHWADPDRYLPAPEMERTGRMNTTAVLDQRQPATPVDRGSVLAEMRDQLSDPAAVVAEIFTAAGCPVPETTTPGGDQ